MIGTHPTNDSCPRPAVGRPADPPALSARRVLVTGARGFIGSHLLRRLLDADADVHAVVRPAGSPGRQLPHGPTGRRATFHEADLADPAQADRALRRSDPDVVVHLASSVAGHRRADVLSCMLENNTRAAVNVMIAAHRLGNRRVVLAGSVEEPNGAGEAPCSPYAATKAAATACARLFHQQWDLPVTVLRPAMVYGPGQPDESKLLPYVIGSMLEGHRPRLSSGARPIDWVHVDDVCRAFLLAAVDPATSGLVADIGSGTATTIADTVREVASLIGYSGLLGLGDLPDRADDVARIADLTVAREALGWRPSIPLTQGLTETVDWYAARRGGRPGVATIGPGSPRPSR